MALADLTGKRSAPPKKCTVCWLLETLPTEGENGSDALRDALNNPSVRSIDIARELRDAGYELSDSPVSRHRNGGCIRL